MYVVTIVLTSIYINRHRQAGGHNRPVDLTTFNETAAPAYSPGIVAPEKGATQDVNVSNGQIPQQQQVYVSAQDQQLYSVPQQQQYVTSEQQTYMQPQQQTYAPSPVQSQAQSDQYPTYAGHQHA